MPRTARLLFALFFAVLIGLAFARAKHQRVVYSSLQPPPRIARVDPIPPRILEIPHPTWVHYGVLRQGSGDGSILTDIDAHIMNNRYRDTDRITWAHETSHGICSDLSNRYGSRVVAVYVLHDRAVVIKQPNMTLADVGRLIPSDFRGMSYNLYLQSQQRWWNNDPLYVLNEWDAYTHGSAVRAQLGIKNRGETVLQMVEFNAYALFLANAWKNPDPEFTKFMIWNSVRVKKVYDANKTLGGIDAAEAYVNRLKNVQAISKTYFGEYWKETIFCQE